MGKSNLPEVDQLHRPDKDQDHIHERLNSKDIALCYIEPYIDSREIDASNQDYNGRISRKSSSIVHMDTLCHMVVLDDDKENIDMQGQGLRRSLRRIFENESTTFYVFSSFSIVYYHRPDPRQVEQHQQAGNGHYYYY